MIVKTGARIIIEIGDHKAYAYSDIHELETVFVFIAGQWFYTKRHVTHHVHIAAAEELEKQVYWRNTGNYHVIVVPKALVKTLLHWDAV